MSVREVRRYDWGELRLWRLVGVVALVFVPLWPIAMVILVELFDFPRSLSGVVSVPVALVGMAWLRVAGFVCPECRRPFSRHEKTGTHLTNKRCVSCGVGVGT